MAMTTSEAGNAAALTFDVRPVLLALRGGRTWAIAGVIAGVVCALGAWAWTGQQYESVVTLVVSQPRLSNVPATPVASYRAFIENHTSAVRAIASAGLKRRSTEMTPEWFLDHVVTVEEVRGTNVLRIHVRLPDAAQAAQVVNELARSAVEQHRRLNQDESDSLQDRLKKQTEEAGARLHDSEQRLLEAKRVNQVEVLAADLDGLVKQHGELAQIEANLASERARASAAETERQARSPHLDLTRRIDQDPALLEAARTQATDTRSLVGLQTLTQESNPVYEKVDTELALSRAKIAELDHRRQEILEASTRARANGKFGELYSKQLENQRLEADRALAATIYSDVARRYEEARSVVTTGTAQLQIVDVATPAETPVSWSLFVWLAVGALAGLIVPSLIIALAAITRVVFASIQPAPIS